jgi:hypothetical protein
MNDLWYILTKWIGLIPYELYVVPGMFIALITMLWDESFSPIQIHLLPHWFAYSIGQYIKTHFNRIRPGCTLDEKASRIATEKMRNKIKKQFVPKATKKPVQNGNVFQGMVNNVKTLTGTDQKFKNRRDIDKFFDEKEYFVKMYTKKDGSNITESHCRGKTAVQSFPSGHTLIAFALATSLIMYLLDPLVENKSKIFLKIPFYKKKVRAATISIALIIAVMVSAHRVKHEYHNTTDVVIGGILGMAIGFVSYHICNTLRETCKTYIAKQQPLGKAEKIVYQIVRYVGIALSFIGLIVSLLYDMPRAGDLLH